MSSMFRKKAASKKSVDAYSESDDSESDAATISVSVASRVEPSKPPTPAEPAPPPPKREPMSSESWTIIIVFIVGIIGRLLYANFGGIELYGKSDEANDSLWASLLRDLDAQVNQFSWLKPILDAVNSWGTHLTGVQEGTIGAVIIGVWEGILLHQIMRLSARAAAGVFAGLAGRLLLDLASGSPGQAVRFTASLLGISLGVLLSEVIRGVFDEKDHWEDRKVTHYHNRSRRLRKSSGRRRRTTSAETFEDPDVTDDPRSVAASASAISAGPRSERGGHRHRRALSERDSRSKAESIVRVTSPLPSVLTGDLEAEIADLRMQASAAAGQQRKYQEEQKYEYAQGNGARALQLAWEVKRYEALAESLTRQVGDKIVEAHRRAVEKEISTPLPVAIARPTTPSRSTPRPGGYYSENDVALRNLNPVRVTVSTGGQTYEMTADEEEVEIGPNLRVRTRHVYQPPDTPQPQESGSYVAAAPTTGRSAPLRPAAAAAAPTPTHSRPPRSAPRSKLSNFAQSVGGAEEDMRSVSVGSRARTRSRRGSD